MQHPPKNLMPVDTDTQEKVTYFAQKFGEPHLHLAYHLAFPVTFTPDLAYQIWAHFQRDIHGQHLKVPWVAVADLLLSFLCQEVQNETFRMDEAARRYLLEQMKGDGRFGPLRLQELAHFLGHYIRQQLESQDQYERQAAEVQELQALSILAPDKALNALTGQLTNADLSRGQVRRVASLVDQFSSTAELSAADATTAEAFTQLRDYTQVRAQLTDRRADKQQAVNQLRDQFGESPTIGGQALPGWQTFQPEEQPEPVQQTAATDDTPFEAQQQTQDPPPPEQVEPAFTPLVGLKVRHGDIIDAVTPIYADISADRVFLEQHEGEKIGGEGSSETVLTREGCLVTGINLQRGNYFGRDEVIHLQVIWQKLTAVGLQPIQHRSKQLGNGSYADSSRPPIELRPRPGHYISALEASSSSRTSGETFLHELTIVEAPLPQNLLSLEAQGDQFWNAQKYEEAREAYEQALAQQRELSANPAATAALLNKFGSLLLGQGEYETAQAYYEEALAIRQEVLKPNHPDTASTLRSLSYLLQRQEKYEAALPYLEQAYAIHRELWGDNDEDTILTMYTLGNLLQLAGDYEAAQSRLEQALAIVRKIEGAERDLGNILHYLGTLWLAQDQYEQARPYLEEALAIRREDWGEDDPKTAETRTKLEQLAQQQATTETAVSGVVSANSQFPSIQSANLRSAPSSVGQIVTKLPIGTSFTVIGEGEVQVEGRTNTMTNIRTDSGDEGWIATEWITISFDSVVRGTVSATLKFRDAPSTNGKQIGVLAKGTAFTVMTEEGEVEADGYQWVNIRTDSGQEGWAAADFLTIEKTDENGTAMPEPQADASQSADKYGEAKQAYESAVKLQAEEKYEEARKMYEDAVAIHREANSGQDDYHDNLASLLSPIAELLIKQQKYKEAKSYYDEAFAAYERAYGTIFASVGEYAMAIGDMFYTHEQYQLAEPFYQQAFNNFARAWGPDDSDAKAAAEKLADVKRRY